MLSWYSVWRTVVLVGGLNLYLMVSGGEDHKCDYEAAPRLCGSDHVTPGRCLTLVSTPLDWHAADDYCKNNLPTPGHLAIIEDPDMQAFIAREVGQKGWPETWINGCLKDRLWYWPGHWDFLAYQGCYQDDPSNPDLPIKLPLADNARPTDCISACKAEDSLYAGVQMTYNRTMVCRCSYHKEWTMKYPAVYDAACDTPCSGGLTNTAPINTRCGGINRQIIYRTDGTQFQAWASTSKRFPAECVSLDDTNNHMWVERDCADKIGHICQYDHSNRDSCVAGRGNKWVADTCISLHNEDIDYYQAQRECAHYNGKLMFLSSSEQYTQLIPHLDTQTSYYFGLTHEEWIFSNWKIIFRYFNWGYNQPASGAGQICFMMKADDNYSWYNVDCHARKPFVCLSDVCTPLDNEKPIEETTTTTTTTSKTVTESPHDGGTDRRNKGDEEGDSDDYTKLYYGIGIGVGAMLVLVLIIVGLILCVRRCRRKTDKVADYEYQPTEAVAKPARRLPSVPNPAYQPDIIQVEGAQTKQQVAAREQEKTNPYQEMGDEYDHTYDHIKKAEEWDEDYIEPIPSPGYEDVK